MKFSTLKKKNHDQNVRFKPVYGKFTLEGICCVAVSANDC